MTVSLSPVVVPVITFAGIDAIRVPLEPGNVLQRSRVLRIDGFLATLTSGAFQAIVKNLRDDSVIATLEWTAAGLQTSGGIDLMLNQPGDGLKVLPGTLGVGAQNCILTVWLLLEY